MIKTEGGICAAKGFRASGIHCGIRKNKLKRDLSLIVSKKKASAAATYTTNLVKGAPLTVTKKNLSNGYAQAIICNSGNANTCNANGIEIAEGMCALVEQYAKIPANDVIVASTGVIGQPLDITPIADGMPQLIKELDFSGSRRAAEGIMTTDTRVKEIAFKFQVGDKMCTIGGIAKGSGMIHPNMATMLVFITSDVNIKPEILQTALSEDIKDSFNMVSVDGDTSTNDMCCILANGMSENKCIDSVLSDGYEEFKKALFAVTSYLCRNIARDGEGATRLMEVTVSGAHDKQTARTVAKSVACSSLLKAAIFGADANWGRVLCAIGYSGADLDVNKVGVSFKSVSGEIEVCRNGAGVDFSEEIAKKILLEEEITILITLDSGDASATAWGCDLTYDYVKINGDYRT